MHFWSLHVSRASNFRPASMLHPAAQNPCSGIGLRLSSTPHAASSSSCRPPAGAWRVRQAGHRMKHMTGIASAPPSLMVDVEATVPESREGLACWNTLCGPGKYASDEPVGVQASPLSHRAPDVCVPQPASRAGGRAPPECLRGRHLQPQVNREKEGSAHHVAGREQHQVLQFRVASWPTNLQVTRRWGSSAR